MAKISVSYSWKSAFFQFEILTVLKSLVPGCVFIPFFKATIGVALGYLFMICPNSCAGGYQPIVAFCNISLKRLRSDMMLGKGDSGALVLVGCEIRIKSVEPILTVQSIY